MTSPRVVGRLAPSPTGQLHLGHARSFVLAWWAARASAGRVILRIEDLDGTRADSRFVDLARQDLEWLGLDWDEEHLQTDTLERLDTAIATLIAQGKAYPCVCSRGDIKRAQSAPHADDFREVYPGTCRGRYASVVEAEAATGKPAGVRFLVPSGVTKFRDRVAGTRAQDVAKEVGDFLIAKRDGAPAYQLAVVVDDHLQGVTQVVRGDDLLDSTPRQILLHQALQYDLPEYAHVSLVVDEHGERLAKRADSLSLEALRVAGVSAERVITWIAETAGMGVRRAAQAMNPPQSAAQRSRQRGSFHGNARDHLEAFDFGNLPREPIVAPDLASLKGASD
ncbi:MAG: tRNA glutamyl-Q(34) synthetase GluQRS [Polyangiaceae bacterium]